ncbi:MAG: hypothetical protein P8Z79_15025 [Sedimentisphaerales bacterium]|jgi:hypothetical protein
MESRNYRENSGLDVHATGRQAWLVRIVVTGVFLLLSGGSAFGQYGRFTVTPMKVEAQVTPGKDITTVLNIQNLDPNLSPTIDLAVVELTQARTGEWMTVDPNLVGDPNAAEYGFDLSRLSSCRTWIHMDKNAVTIGPGQLAPVRVTIRASRRTHGFHTAGILATVRPRPGQTGLPMTVRFLVPVVVEIETRPRPARIHATGVGLRFEPANANRPSTTFVTMDVQNDGGTLSELKPLARIYAFSKNHWHLITTTEFDDKRIIPGAIITLEADSGRSLPSGTYKVEGELYVDGRRTKPVQQVFEFEGDPTITRVAADAPLDLKPLDLTIECAPGSLRSQTITVYNASDEAVNIQTASGLPSLLQQVVGADIKGADLDCTSWLKISPASFTLRGGGGRQNVQVVAKLPANAVYPCYYSLLALWATYPDGQRAGYRTANIFLKNHNVAAEPAALGLGVNLQPLTESKYLVTATFRNLKTIYFKPLSVKAGVIPTEGIGAGTVPRISTYMSGNPGAMLPFETRTFSGDLDFAMVPPGRYVLSGRLEFGAGQVARSVRLIDVSVQGDRRVIQTVGTQQELGGTVEVNW